MTLTVTLFAREYQRVSFDASGRERSPEEQHVDNQRAAARHDWQLGAAYRDVGSASRYARKIREDYARLIADLKSGAFGASVLILWESSRGSRRLSEWVRLIELCEEHSVKIYVTSDGKLYDPRDARDRRSLQEDAVDAEYESAKTSKRVTRSSAASAAEGRPGPGSAPYGFRRTYDPATGKLGGQEIEPTEAAIVREIYQRLNAGHSLRSIANDLEARGVRTRAGRPFSPHTLRSIALNRANIGERVHDPDGQNRPYGSLSARAAVTAATWPPIVDRALWTAVYQRLTDPARVTTRPARAVHWLSGIALCDVCGGPMQPRQRHDRGGYLVYVCFKAAHTAVPYADLDTYAEAVLLAYLGRDDISHQLTAQPLDPAALGAVEAELAAAQQEANDLADQLGQGNATARAVLARALPGIDARIKAAQVRKDELTAPSRLRGLIQPGKDVRRRWQLAPTSARREIAKLIFVPDLLGELRVVKGPLRDPVQTRVTWRRA